MTPDPESYAIERPNRAVLIVRMRSKPRGGVQLPDASFTFRYGDPQYDLWERRYWEQRQRREEEAARESFR